MRRVSAGRPPVDGRRVARVGDDLRCEILGRATERPRALLDDLRETKVDDFDVAGDVKEQVLRLEVAVRD